MVPPESGHFVASYCMSNAHPCKLRHFIKSIVLITFIAGALDGGPQCRLSILRNGNVPCYYFQSFPVDFKVVQCRLSILRNDNLPCCYFANVPVDFKVVQCRLSNLRKRHVALSILMVKGPIAHGFRQELQNYGFKTFMLLNYGHIFPHSTSSIT